MTAEPFDIDRARLGEPDQFDRFRVPEDGEPLRNSGLPGSTELLVVARGGQRRALLLREMAYHHLAQGKLADEPYLVSF